MNNAGNLELSVSIARLERDFHALCRRHDVNLELSLKLIGGLDTECDVKLLGTFEAKENGQTR